MSTPKLKSILRVKKQAKESDSQQAHSGNESNETQKKEARVRVPCNDFEIVEKSFPETSQEANDTTQSENVEEKVEVSQDSDEYGYDEYDEYDGEDEEDEDDSDYYLFKPFDLRDMGNELNDVTKELEDHRFTSFMSLWQALSNFTEPLHRIDRNLESQNSKANDEKPSESDLFEAAAIAKKSLQPSENQEDNDVDSEKPKLEDNKPLRIRRQLVQSELLQASNTLLSLIPDAKSKISSRIMSEFITKKIEGFSLDWQLISLSHNEWVALLSVMILSEPSFSQQNSIEVSNQTILSILDSLGIKFSGRELEILIDKMQKSS